ncbi:MAG: hypothetical protein KAI63_02280 [Planctomycetes bacterium]|nr:hypothetical protein [Planctomycetota bacterium]
MRYFYLFVLVLFCLTVGWTEEGKESEKPADPVEILQAAADSWYDLEEQGVKYYSCFVKSPELIKNFKSRSPRAKVILDDVDYLMTWRPNRQITVKPTDFPAFFGIDAREDAQNYARQIQIQLNKTFKSINPIKNLLKVLKALGKTNAFEITMEKDKSLQKITLKEKKSGGRRGSGRRSPLRDRLRKRRNQPGDEEDTAGTGGGDSVTYIWVNKKNIIEKTETTNAQGKVVMKVKAKVYKKMWNISKLDITKYDDQERFEDRVIVLASYVNPKQVMLPSRLKLSIYDKKGKLVDRRDEVNPIGITFSKHDVEVK